jgi:starch-binding outer membrane protein, SusD/RagB family
MWIQLTAVEVVNGVDARMIEAEVTMAALIDPGTEDGRVNMQFREKACWTCSRGQRLGNMRRLIRQYGRTVATVRPQGVHHKGGNYGKDVNLPVTQPEENNPNVKSCTDRNP